MRYHELWCPLFHRNLAKSWNTGHHHSIKWLFLCILIWQKKRTLARKNEEVCALWWIRTGVTVGILKCCPIPAHLFWSYKNSHRSLSQQFVYLHRRVRRLHCLIFAKTWTAHRPFNLMLRSFLLETSIRLTSRKLFLNSINILNQSQWE